MSNSRVHLQPRKTVRKTDWRAFWPAWLLFAVLIGLFGYNLLTQYIDDLSPESDVTLSALGPDQDLQVQTSSLLPGDLHLFQAVVAGKKFSFVVQRTNGNTIHVAIATCLSCRRSAKTNYARKGEYFCGECRHAMRFESRDGHVEHEGCIMPEIPHSESNGMLTVRASDVKAAFDTTFAKSDQKP